MQPTPNRELGAFAEVDRTDAGDFIDRLDRMSAYAGAQAYKRLTFARMRLEPGMRVADIGCGAGDDARALADIVGAAGCVVGVDLSAAMIAEANQRFGEVPGLEFKQASALDLPFADGTFDAVRIDRVLIHVAEFERALAEAVRVLKPGGRIVASEPDMPGFWIASDDPECAALVSDGIAHSCASPYAPRHLQVALRDLALDDVSFEAVAIPSDDHPTVTKLFSIDHVLTALATQETAPEERIERFREEQAERARTGRFSSGLTVMIAAGTRPDSGTTGFLLTPP